jgi:hypothetical protein
MLTTTLRGAIVALILAADTSLPAQDAKLPPAAEIIDRFVKVTHSDEVVNSRRSIRTRGRVEAVAPGAATEVMEIRLKPNLMRVELTRPGRGVLLSGFDGKNAWAQDPATGPRLYTGKDLEDRSLTASFDHPLRSAAAYPTRETIEVAEFAGEKCYRVRMVSATGRESFECFSTTSGLLIAVQ